MPVKIQIKKKIQTVIDKYGNIIPKEEWFRQQDSYRFGNPAKVVGGTKTSEETKKE